MFVQVTVLSLVVALQVVLQPGWPPEPDIPAVVHFSMKPLLSTITLLTLYECEACQTAAAVS